MKHKKARTRSVKVYASTHATLTTLKNISHIPIQHIMDNAIADLEAKFLKTGRLEVATKRSK